ncbi:MAG TPA: 3-isopropylmalate dehydrogenase [Steroidobacteraceae bacterium]|jgi:3-isopropylmalate dehydrogenase|nr:3-isopropylmalate dehydrogenase [Steroidobacteraceae bacterium]
MQATIAVLAGDGIGAEVTAEAVRALQKVASRFDHRFEFESGLLGGAAIDATGSPLPPATLALATRADAILLGAVGGPQWSDPNAAVRPEQGLLQLRKALGLFANLRPVVPHPAVLDASPIKGELLRGVDIMVVRELTGGIYFGEKTRTATEAVDICRYSVMEIERVVRLAAHLARARRKKLTSVDKANVLETSRLWRSTVNLIMPAEFPDVAVEHMLVDSAAMHLLQRPRDFDVIVTENMFGDILTDEASMLAGSLGLLPSASLGANSRGGLFEPIHGSAPDIAGRGMANPYAAISSAAMLLRYSLRLDAEAKALDEAVYRAISGGALTADLAAPGKSITTRAAADAVLAVL